MKTKKVLFAFVSILLVAVFALPGPSLDASAGLFDSPVPEPPINDEFDGAIVIESLPFTDYRDTTYATWSPNDPYDCSSNGSVWYAFTPETDILLEANTIGSNYDTTLAAYTGTLGSFSLVPGACNDDYYGLQSRVTVSASAGTTYYFLVGFCCGSGGNGGGSLVFTVQEYVPPPPEVYFYYDPWSPSIYSTVQFWESCWDPAGVGIETYEWDLGDGTTAEGCCPTHNYAADGEYTVKLVAMTYDGRTGSASQIVPVETHDVAIIKFGVPAAAKAGQTRSLIVGLSNTRYPEQVEVQLYKGVPGGYDPYELVGSLTQQVPVRPVNRTTDFRFSYTFTSDDADIGKVTFKAVAHLRDAQDALQADNEAISKPTKVNP